MRLGGLALLLVLLAAALPLACSGDDEDAASRPASTEATSAPASTEAETAPATTAEEGGASAASTAITEAAERTAAAGSARMAAEIVLAGAGVDAQTFGGEGLFDFDEGSGELALNLVGSGGGDSSHSRVVFVDYDVYYELPPGILPSGRSWLRLDLASLVEASAVDFGSLMQGSQADPAQHLLWLRAVGPEVERLGEETVRGETTTRYRGAVELDRLAAQAPAGREAEWEAYVEATRQRLGRDSVPVEVWVDGEGLVRRLRQEYTFGAGAGEISTTVTTELYDFGVEVDVAPPPPDQVAEIGDLIRP